MDELSSCDTKCPQSFSTDAPLSTQWMWLIDEIEYVSKRFPMFLNKSKDLLFAEKINAVFKIIDPANHSDAAVRGGYKGLVETARGNDEKSGIVYVVGIALSYWDIYKTSPALAETFYQQALDYPSAFGMVLAYVFVFVQEYSSGAGTVTSSPVNDDGGSSVGKKSVTARVGTEQGCSRSYGTVLLSSALFVILLIFLRWHYEQKINRLAYSSRLSWPGQHSFSNLASNPAILSANKELARLKALSPPLAYTNYLSVTPPVKDLSLITMCGNLSAKLPKGYKVTVKETNYVEVADEDGVPSIFILCDTLDDRMSKLVEALDGTDTILKSFVKSQEKIENKKTELMAIGGVDSSIIQWGTPYTLKGFKCSALGVDFVRHDKSSLLGKPFESRTFCTNLQIINNSRMYQVNIKRMTEVKTPLDCPIPKHLLAFIASLSISKAPSP